MAKCAAENGGRIQAGEKPVGDHSFIALVLDAEGTFIGLHSMK